MVMMFYGPCNYMYNTYHRMHANIFSQNNEHRISERLLRIFKPVFKQYEKSASKKCLRCYLVFYGDLRNTTMVIISYPRDAPCLTGA